MFALFDRLPDIAQTFRECMDDPSNTVLLRSVYRMWSMLSLLCLFSANMFSCQLERVSVWRRSLVNRRWRLKVIPALRHMQLQCLPNYYFFKTLHPCTCGVVGQATRPVQCKIFENCALKTLILWKFVHKVPSVHLAIATCFQSIPLHATRYFLNTLLMN